MNLREQLTELSHEFGAAAYVKGGGGNTSAKEGDRIWIKPSGTTLVGLKPTDFIPLDKNAVNALFSMSLPESSAAREELVKNTMSGAVLDGYMGRPSVESPLHAMLDGRFVVHTHPELVNGMTCSVGGMDACGRLFPEAMWVRYIDPGFTLCMKLKQLLDEHVRIHSRQPEVIFIENHGVFVGADSLARVRELYRHILETLGEEYRKKGITGGVSLGAPDFAKQTRDKREIKAVLGEEAGHIASSPLFPVAKGPLTPDHIVYSKAWPFFGEIEKAKVDGFRDSYSYFPKVLVTASGVYGVGKSPASARLALELAVDGAVVCRYAEAFGGIQYMSRKAADFIENWEVESYRRTQVA